MALKIVSPISVVALRASLYPIVISFLNIVEKMSETETLLIKYCLMECYMFGLVFISQVQMPSGNWCSCFRSNLISGCIYLGCQDILVSNPFPFRHFERFNETHELTR